MRYRIFSFQKRARQIQDIHSRRIADELIETISRHHCFYENYETLVEEEYYDADRPDVQKVLKYLLG